MDPRSRRSGPQDMDAMSQASGHRDQTHHGSTALDRLVYKRAVGNSVRDLLLVPHVSNIMFMSTILQSPLLKLFVEHPVKTVNKHCLDLAATFAPHC